MRCFPPLFIWIVTLSCFVPNSSAEPRKSLLNNDPEVLYLENFFTTPLSMTSTRPVPVYASRRGKRRLGNLLAHTPVTILALTPKAYKIKGKAQHGSIMGWVNPHFFTIEKQPHFIEDFKILYTRQKEVESLINNHEVAIGMSLDEVRSSLGQPTQTEITQNKKGQSGSWSYISQKEVKHYRTVQDSRTGMIYKQYTHTTVEETQRITIAFENSIVTSITRKTAQPGSNVRIIPPPPVIFIR